MIKIEFEPFEEMTREDWEEIIEFIGMYGGEIKVENEGE